MALVRAGIAEFLPDPLPRCDFSTNELTMTDQDTLCEIFPNIQCAIPFPPFLLLYYVDYEEVDRVHFRHVGNLIPFALVIGPYGPVRTGSETTATPPNAVADVADPLPDSDLSQQRHLDERMLQIAESAFPGAVSFVALQSSDGQAILLVGHSTFDSLWRAKCSASLPRCFAQALVVHRLHSVRLAMRHPALERVVAPPPHGVPARSHSDSNIFPGTGALGPYLKTSVGPFVLNDQGIFGIIPTHILVVPFKTSTVNTIRKFCFRRFCMSRKKRVRFLGKPIYHCCSPGRLILGSVSESLDDMTNVYDSSDSFIMNVHDITLYAISEGRSVSNTLPLLDGSGCAQDIHLNQWADLNELIPGRVYELYPEWLGMNRVIQARYMHSIQRFRVYDGNRHLILDVAVFITSVPNNELDGACGTPLFMRCDDGISGRIFGFVRLLTSSSGNGLSNEIMVCRVPDQISQFTLV